MTSRRSKPQPGFTRGPRIADLMTREYVQFLEKLLRGREEWRRGDGA